MSASSLIYCSGPLFSPEEVAAMERIAALFEAAGYRTYLPHRDGVEAFVMPRVNSFLAAATPWARDAVDRAIFALDVFQLVERCDAVVVNLNGRVPDEGAAVEAGIAFAVGCPVVLYKDDARSAFSGRDNSMLLGLAASPPVAKLERLRAAVERALSRSGRSRDVAISAELARVSSRGRHLWALLKRLPCPGTPDAVREILDALTQPGG